jgi:hypothetical protein
VEKHACSWPVNVFRSFLPVVIDPVSDFTRAPGEQVSYCVVEGEIHM